LWIFLFGTIAQGIAVLAGVAGIAASVLYTFIGRIGFQYYTAIVVASVLAFLFLGGYGWLDFLNKIMMAVLFLATVVVFVPACPPRGEFVHLIKPSIPAGSLAVIAALLGWMPTGIDVSIWHSLWTIEKHPELSAAEGKAAESRWRILRLALADMRIGYVLSFVVAAVFLMLAASFLHGTSSEIEGVGFSKSLADMYAERIGRWMFGVFMVAAFFAMYSTTYAVMDGFSRCFAETLSKLFPELPKKGWNTLYRIFVLATALLAFVLVITIGKPVKLVMIVALISLAVAPLYYGLNYYCVTRFIEDRRFRPKMPARFMAIVGIAIMFIAALVYAASTLNILK
jgi:Mn2+/Fe2+ NRAMP family transporter